MAVVWVSGKTCLYILGQELALWADHRQNSQCPATQGMGMSNFPLDTQTVGDENSWQKGFLS